MEAGALKICQDSLSQDDSMYFLMIYSILILMSYWLKYKAHISIVGLRFVFLVIFIILPQVELGTVTSTDGLP